MKKVVIVGAGPVGALAAIYAAERGHDVEVYELRSGELWYFLVISSAVSLPGLSHGFIVE
jgi:2-polyprenyl-6-methoxyphenol hydroxylase-like FAD-dependent oxidoreductase